MLKALSANLKKKLYIIIMIILIILIILMICLIVFKVKIYISENEVAETMSEPVKIDDTFVIVVDNNDEEEKMENENATGIIYLTFDDGPSNSTPQILDILEKNNIKSTFFVIHYDEEKEKFIKREQKDEDTIALHGYVHTYSEVYCNADSCIENFKKIQEQVRQTTGRISKIIRFPGGSSNTISKKYCVGVMSEVTQRVLNEVFRYFDWNVDSGDAGSAKNSDDVYNNVISGVVTHKESVVLMHDFSNNDKTIGALQRIIDFGKTNRICF